MTIDELLEQELERNPEMKAVFEKDPEKKELYKKKIADTWDQKTGFTESENDNRCKYCKNCIFARGDPPFADAPEKAYCRIYTREGGKGKPPEVYYDGARCEFYEQEKRKN